MAARCHAWRCTHKQKKMKRYLPFLIIAAVFVAALAGFLWLRRSGGASNASVSFIPPASKADNTNAAANTSSPGPDSATVTKPNIKVSSPVEVEEYGDYQCPPCGVLYPELKKIEDEYGKQVHFVFHYFPLNTIHKNAMAAARAAEAARLQNKFWEMHDRLYRNQSTWADAADPRPVFISYAEQLGLNTQQFQNDMDSNRVEQAISADVQRGMLLGIKGTPTLLIDGLQLNAEATTPNGIRRGINMMMERKAVS